MDYEKLSSGYFSNRSSGHFIWSGNKFRKMCTFSILPSVPLCELLDWVLQMFFFLEQICHNTCSFSLCLLVCCEWKVLIRRWQWRFYLIITNSLQCMEMIMMINVGFRKIGMEKEFPSIFQYLSLRIIISSIQKHYVKSWFRRLQATHASIFIIFNFYYQNLYFDIHHYI